MDVHEALALAIDATDELAGILETGEVPALGEDRDAEIDASIRLREAADRLQQDVAIIDTSEPVVD